MSLTVDRVLKGGQGEEPHRGQSVEGRAGRGASPWTEC